MREAVNRLFGLVRFSRHDSDGLAIRFPVSLFACRIAPRILKLFLVDLCRLITVNGLTSRSAVPLRRRSNRLCTQHCGRVGGWCPRIRHHTAHGMHGATREHVSLPEQCKPSVVTGEIAATTESGIFPFVVSFPSRMIQYRSSALLLDSIVSPCYACWANACRT